MATIPDLLFMKIHTKGVRIQAVMMGAEGNWKALKHFLHYIKGTADHKLTYQGNLASNELFLTYTEASHGDFVDTGYSTAGFVTMMAEGAIGSYSNCCTFYH